MKTIKSQYLNTFDKLTNLKKQTLNQPVKNIFKNQQPVLKSIKTSCYQNKEVITSQKEINERNITPYE